MKTFIEWFSVKLFEGAQSEEQLVKALSNWVGPIVKNPHLDDIRTWVSMVRKLSPQIRSGFMLDMISAVGEAISQLPREDQAEAERLMASVDDSPQVQNQMVARGYLPTMERPWKFYTPEQLEDYLAKAMELDNPNLEVIDRVGQENQEHFHALGDEFKAAFIDWFEDQLKSRAGSKSMGDMLKQHMQSGMKMSDEDDLPKVNWIKSPGDPIHGGSTGTFKYNGTTFIFKQRGKDQGFVWDVWPEDNPRSALQARGWMDAIKLMMKKVNES